MQVLLFLTHLHKIPHPIIFLEVLQLFPLSFLIFDFLPFHQFFLIQLFDIFIIQLQLAFLHTFLLVADNLLSAEDVSFGIVLGILFILVSLSLELLRAVTLLPLLLLPLLDIIFQLFSMHLEPFPQRMLLVLILSSLYFLFVLCLFHLLLFLLHLLLLSLFSFLLLLDVETLRLPPSLLLLFLSCLVILLLFVSVLLFSLLILLLLIFFLLFIVHLLFLSKVFKFLLFRVILPVFLIVVFVHAPIFVIFRLGSLNIDLRVHLFKANGGVKRPSNLI
mmetsp:Transcript_34941/g.33982  ORF Transcript_34941/g.33982 Transcript_34941/m.33982 type:complete len:276 (-) Transcript_34941:684-1511(-)